MSALFVMVLVMFGVGLALAILVGTWRERVITEAARPKDGFQRTAAAPVITVVIPARNAEASIAPLLQDLYAQDYPKDHLYVIVVDDHSEDGTAVRVQGMRAKWPQLGFYRTEGEGKKSAITTALEHVSNGIVLLTDADVRCGPHRVRCVAEAWMRNPFDLLLLPVATHGQGWLGALQQDEQAGLMMVAAAEALERRPLLANGANMAFTPSAFQQVGGYAGDTYASGDDVFLVQRMERAGKRIDYLLDPAAVVNAEAEGTVAAAIQQRLRWAGKMRGTGIGAILLPMLAIFYPWLLLALTLTPDWMSEIGSASFFSILLLTVSWLLWLLPVPVGVVTMERVLGQKSSLPGALLSHLAFAVYAPVIGVLAPFVRPRWRGRRLAR